MDSKKFLAIGIPILVAGAFIGKKREEEPSCPVCARKFQINSVGESIIENYIMVSDDNKLGWKSQENPGGVPRTSLNIAGQELFYYREQALTHYLQEGKRSKVFNSVVYLLRTSLVPQELSGGVIHYVQLLDEPVFDKDFTEEWESEVFNHEDHDEIDELIEDLDKLTAFCISFLHDGAYGGESLGREDMGDGLEEERVRYVEGSIELKFVYEDGENILIRASYTDETDGPVIYLPPARFIKNQPDNPRGGVHEH